MKNKNMVIIIVLAVVLIGGMYYFASGDKGKKVVEEPPIIQDQEDTEELPQVPDEPVVADIAVGALAPDFTLKNLDGEEVTLSDYKGKIVLVNFWATWCGFCDKEMPDLQTISNENDDLVVLAVDVAEKQSVVEAYIKKGSYDFEVLLDTDGSLSETYLVSGYPTSYFIDKEGILLGAVPQMLTYPQMNEILESIREKE